MYVYKEEVVDYWQKVLKIVNLIFFQGTCNLNHTYCIQTQKTQKWSSWYVNQHKKLRKPASVLLFYRNWPEVLATFIYFIFPPLHAFLFLARNQFAEIKGHILHNENAVQNVITARKDYFLWVICTSFPRVLISVESTSYIRRKADFHEITN